MAHRSSLSGNFHRTKLHASGNSSRLKAFLWTDTTPVIEFWLSLWLLPRLNGEAARFELQAYRASTVFTMPLHSTIEQLEQEVDKYLDLWIASGEWYTGKRMTMPYQAPACSEKEDEDE